MNNKNKLFSDSDKAVIIHDATKEINKPLSSEGRRRFLKQGLTLFIARTKLRRLMARIIALRLQV